MGIKLSKEDITKIAEKVLNSTDNIVSTVANTAVDVAEKSKDLVNAQKDAITEKLDYNGDGKVGIDDIICGALKIPGVRIDRASFLQKELFKNHPQEVIDKAIASTPANAGISKEEIEKISNEVINLERNEVSGISAALGIPGGIAMVATIPADILQYYGYTLRAVQKLLYLYGFPEIGEDKDGILLDSETINAITLCLGVMNGVAGANNAIKGMAKALAGGVEKQLLKQALTKGTIYPFVKSVVKWFGVNLTKQTFTGVIKNSIPVVGGVLGGGITFAMFKPCCLRLKNALKDTMLSNPDHVSTEAENKFAEAIASGEIIDIEYEDITEVNEEENIGAAATDSENN